MTDNLIALKRRLKKLGIEIEYIANYPWIYLYKINGKRVKELYQANHGFTIAYMPMDNTGQTKIVNMRKTFKLIRKYL